jgi:hypothetical protein
VIALVLAAVALVFGLTLLQSVLCPCAACCRDKRGRS